MSEEEFNLTKKFVKERKEFPLNTSQVKNINIHKDVLVWMKPSRFLELASPLKNPNQEAVNSYANLIERGKPITPLTLFVEESKINGIGLVVGHEGRHRALASEKEGVKQVPVILKFKDGTIYKNTEYPNSPEILSERAFALQDKWDTITPEDFIVELEYLEESIDRPPTFCSTQYLKSEKVLSCRIEPQSETYLKKKGGYF